MQFGGATQQALRYIYVEDTGVDGGEEEGLRSKRQSRLQFMGAKALHQRAAPAGQGG